MFLVLSTMFLVLYLVQRLQPLPICNKSKRNWNIILYIILFQCNYVAMKGNLSKEFIELLPQIEELSLKLKGSERFDLSWPQWVTSFYLLTGMMKILKPLKIHIHCLFPFSHFIYLLSSLFKCLIHQCWNELARIKVTQTSWSNSRIIRSIPSSNWSHLPSFLQNTCYCTMWSGTGVGIRTDPSGRPLPSFLDLTQLGRINWVHGNWDIIILILNLVKEQ